MRSREKRRLRREHGHRRRRHRRRRHHTCEQHEMACYESLPIVLRVYILRLAMQPLLEEWYVSNGYEDSEYMAPESKIQVLVGRVSNHPHVSDDEIISTSRLVNILRSLSYGRTLNRVYLLGSPHPEYEIWQRNREIRLARKRERRLKRAFECDIGALLVQAMFTKWAKCTTQGS